MHPQLYKKKSTTSKSALIILYLPSDAHQNFHLLKLSYVYLEQAVTVKEKHLK